MAFTIALYSYREAHINRRPSTTKPKDFDKTSSQRRVSQRSQSKKEIITEINKMPGATMSPANISIDKERLMLNIHHTAQFGIGERWGE
jgi:hypothetical protein